MPHIHEKIDFTVGIWIVHRNKLLLIHHRALERWLPVGGHIELYEDPDQACIREAVEESGIHPENIEIVGFKPPLSSTSERKLLYTPTFMDIHKISDTHRHIGLGYLARAKTDQVVLAEREHLAIRWFTAEELLLDEFGIKNDSIMLWYCQEALNRLSW